MIWSLFASIPAIGTGLMSTLCCVGPATLNLLRLGGFNIGPWFAEHRIYNVSATILLLGIAYYLEYGKNDETDPTSELNKRSLGKILLWTAYGLIIFFKLTPEVITFIYNH